MTDEQLTNIAEELKKLLPPSTGFTLTVVPLNNLGPSRVRFISNLDEQTSVRMAQHVIDGITKHQKPGLILPT